MKLEHFPLSSYFLIAGLGTEAIIFFFAGFEPLPDDWEWDRVYPELADKAPKVERKIVRPSASGSALERFDEMLAAGFMDEVKTLRTNTRLHANLPAIRSVGYRQAWEFLNGEIDAEEMRYKALAATRQLGKRQLTWLRAIDGRSTFDPFNPEELKAALDYCKNNLIQK